MSNSNTGDKELATRGLKTTVAKATMVFRNEFPSTSTHLRQLARIERRTQPAPYPTWDSLPDKHKAVFADDLYVYVSVEELLVSKNGMQCLPKTDRKNLALLLPNYHKTLSTNMVQPRGKNDGGVPVYGKHPMVLVNIKTEEVPLSQMVELVALFKQFGGQLTLNNTVVRWCNIDFTDNFPGAVKPVAQKERKPILGGSYVPKTNAHWVGLQCITFTENTDAAARPYAPVRYNVEDAEGNGRAVQYQLGGVDAKVYCKFAFHLETTSVASTTGNNLCNLFRSPSTNIHNAMRDAEVQQHGFGRLELRFSDLAKTPTTVAALSATMAHFYDAIVPTYCHSESFADTLGWFLAPEQMQQVAVVNLAPRTGEFDICLVRWGNLLTGNYNELSYHATSKDRAIHFLSASKMAKTALAVYWEKTEGKYELAQFGDTDFVPNIEYVKTQTKNGTDNYHTKSMWAKVAAAEVGLDCESFPFLVTHLTAKPPLLSFDEAAAIQPNLASKKQYDKKVKLWADMAKKAQARLLKELATPGNKDRHAAYKFSVVPETDGLVKNVYIDKFDNLCVQLGNGKSYKANSVLKAEANRLLKTGEYKKIPVVLVKGVQTGVYDRGGGKAPVYGNAKFVYCDTEDSCNLREATRKYAILHWDLFDFERYSGLVIP